MELVKKKEIELNAMQMLAVRLVEALNYKATTIPGFKQIRGGMKVEIRAEQYGIDVRPKLIIKPAGWPKGSFIICFLVMSDGVYRFCDGKILTPHIGNWKFDGYDNTPSYYSVPTQDGPTHVLGVYPE